MEYDQLLRILSHLTHISICFTISRIPTGLQKGTQQLPAYSHFKDNCKIRSNQRILTSWPTELTAALTHFLNHLIYRTRPLVTTLESKIKSFKHLEERYYLHSTVKKNVFGWDSPRCLRGNAAWRLYRFTETGINPSSALYLYGPLINYSTSLSLSFLFGIMVIVTALTPHRFVW